MFQKDNPETGLPIGPDDSPSGCTAARLFEQVWEALADVLGPATTATLLRRCVKYAASRQPSLSEVEIKREGFEYRYVLPPGWDGSSPESIAALRVLVHELWHLLVPLTDRIVVRRLEGLADVRRCGLVPPEDSP